MRLPIFFFAATACLSLAGCAGSPLQANASLAALRPEATTLSIVGIDGLNEEAGRRFQDILAREAKARGFTIVAADSGSTNKLKAHLSSYPVEGGKLAFSWVIQTSQDGRNLSARVSGATLANAPASSGWSAFDDPLMRQVAARGIDDLARVLTNNAAPEEAPPAE